MDDEKKSLQSRDLEIENEENEDFQIIFDYLPKISFYQAVIVFLTGYCNVAAGSLQLAQIILQANPDTQTCINSTALEWNVTENGCDAMEKCSNYNYTSELFDETVVTQWNLVCENSFRSSLISSLSLCGLLIGALLFGYLGDVIGRRNALFLSSSGAFIFGMLTSIASVNLTAYTIYRLLAGAFVHGSIPIAVVYALEYVGPAYRAWSGAVGYMLFDVGIANLSLVGYLFKHWTDQALTLSILPLVLFIFCFFLPKSLQFLYSRGDYEEGKLYLKRFMKYTNTDDSILEKLSLKLERISSRQNQNKNDSGNAWSEIFGSNYIRITIQVCLIFFVACLGNYGFLLNPSGLQGNILMNNIYMSFFDMLGYLVMAPMLDYFGRVRTLTGAYSITGGSIIISSLITYFFPEVAFLGTVCRVLVFIGKMFNAVTFGAVFNYTAELYPTHLRTTAVGIGSSVARIGGILAPQILYLQFISDILPPIIIGICSCLAAYISSLMPETNKRPLMQTTNEAIKFYSESKG